jgi:membrane-associated protease RseP (regulator of RpoE activity)
MATSRTVPDGLPDPDSIGAAFHYGEPLADAAEVVQRVAPQFRERGYRVRITYETGEHVLVARERSTTVDSVPWLNVALFLATVATTLFAGAQWYGYDVAANPARALAAWPFSAAVLVPLAVHEFGHYAASRYHDVEASLPYFVPVPTALGTLGAVISMRDHLPDRKALFDIGVAGPLAGLVATVVVTAVGVSLPPVDVSGAGEFAAARQYELGYPPLVQAVAYLLGEPLQYADPDLAVNPVVVGGWVGAFVTFLNLLPVGQLDGAHVARALVGERVAALRYVVPAALFGLAGVVGTVVGGQAAVLWVVWGGITLLFGRAGTATPLDDSDVDRKRKLVGAATLVLGLLCFTPVPLVLA